VPDVLGHVPRRLLCHVDILGQLNVGNALGMGHVSSQMAANHFGNNLMGLSANIVPVDNQAKRPMALTAFMAQTVAIAIDAFRIAASVGVTASALRLSMVGARSMAAWTCRRSNDCASWRPNTPSSSGLSRPDAGHSLNEGTVGNKLATPMAKRKAVRFFDR